MSAASTPSRRPVSSPVVRKPKSKGVLRVQANGAEWRLSRVRCERLADRPRGRQFDLLRPTLRIGHRRARARRDWPWRLESEPHDRLLPDRCAARGAAHGARLRRARDPAAHPRADSTATYDRSLYEKMGGAGLLGLPIPERYGGPGMDYIAFALLCEEMERADTAFRVILSVHTGLNSLTLLQWANEEQKQRYLVPQARGEKLATFGLTEPGVGQRRRQPVDHRAPRRRPLPPQRQQDLDQPGRHRRPLPGLRHGRQEQAATRASPPSSSSAASPASAPIRCTASSACAPATPASSTFSDCEVPAANRVGEEGEGFTIAMSAIDQGRYTVAAGIGRAGAGVPGRIGQVRA